MNYIRRMSTDTDTPQYLTPRQAATMMTAAWGIEVSADQIRARMREGKIPSRQLPVGSPKAHRYVARSVIESIIDGTFKPEDN